MITSFLRLMSVASIVVFAAASAVAAATGSITGRVQNVVTGQYLNQARVTLRGGDHVTFTDNFGTYRLVGVPAGPAVVEFFYTDLDPVVVNLTVPAGGVIERHVDLTSAQRYGRDATAVKLNAFVVASDKETDAQAIATNEQRFAPNLKNVLSTDALGDVLGGSVGEFLKFMPGLTADSASTQRTRIAGKDLPLEETIAITESLPPDLIKNCMLFIMRNGIVPMWEDPKNRHGGCFSYKVSNKHVFEVWRDLTYVLIGETISSSNAFVNNVSGITISPKKN